MAAGELDRLAARQLADYDARTPGQLFNQPVDLTILQAYELQSAVARAAKEGP